MANVVANNAMGRLVEFVRDGGDLLVVLLKAAEADATVRDYDDLDTLLTQAGNTEADFTNYARKTVSNANVTVTVDDSGNKVDLDFPDQVWSNAGGTTNNTLVKLVVCMDGGGADSTHIPGTIHDFSVTTDGTDLTAQVDSAGFWGSS